MPRCIHRSTKFFVCVVVLSLLVLKNAFTTLNYMTHNEAAPPFQCAPWIPPSQRRIMIRKSSLYGSRMSSFDDYVAGRSNYNGGEAYWSASMDYVFRSMGFAVVYDEKTWGSKEELDALRNNSEEEDNNTNNGYYYRILVDGTWKKGMFTQQALKDEIVQCRARAMAWWPLSTEKGETNEDDNRKVLTPFPYSAPELSSSHASFIIHSTVTLPPLTGTNRNEKTGAHIRGRSAFILGKGCSISQILLNGFLDAGFHLHFACDRDGESSLNAMVKSENKENLHVHPTKTPGEFSKLLRTVAMVIGLGDPVDSPTPLEGLANGAAFLNPIYDKTSISSDDDDIYQRYQHEPLRNLGFPYVYNYEKGWVGGDETITLKSMLTMAERAYQNPFTSYVPEGHRLESVQAQLCANVIESDVLCTCPIAAAKAGIDVKEFCNGDYNVRTKVSEYE